MNEAAKFQNLQNLLSQKAKLEEQISAIRDDLKASIPSNTSIEGVYHKVVQRKDVKYAEACRRIIDMLVAESKRQKAWVIVEQLTSYGESHSFAPAKDSAMPRAEEEALA